MARTWRVSHQTRLKKGLGGRRAKTAPGRFVRELAPPPT
jgi:hypothetical protein